MTKQGLLFVCLLVPNLAFAGETPAGAGSATPQVNADAPVVSSKTPKAQSKLVPTIIGTAVGGGLGALIGIGLLAINPPEVRSGAPEGAAITSIVTVWGGGIVGAVIGGVAGFSYR